MWLMKVKESQQFQFFVSYAIDIHANEFQPTNKAANKAAWFIGQDVGFDCISS